MSLNVNILDNGVCLISFPPAIYDLSTFVFFPSLPFSSIGVLVRLGPFCVILVPYSCSSFRSYVYWVSCTGSL